MSLPAEDDRSESWATDPPQERKKAATTDASRRAVDSMVLVEARELNRHFLKDWLNTCWPRLEVLPAADPAELAIRRKSLRRARFILMSIGQQRVASQPVRYALARLGELAPGVPLIVLAELEHADDIALAIRAGARGFVPTSLDRGAATRAIEFVLAGGTFVPVGILAAIGENGAAQMALGMPRLTPREFQVARLICAGLPNKLIAHELCISEATVKVFVRKILSKLGVHNRTEAALAARRHFATDFEPEDGILKATAD